MKPKFWRDLLPLKGEATAVDPIFRSRKGGSLDASQVRRIVYAAAQKAGLEQKVRVQACVRLRRPPHDVQLLQRRGAVSAGRAARHLVDEPAHPGQAGQGRALGGGHLDHARQAGVAGSMPALPLDEAGKYVAGAYGVFVALILVYVAIMAAKLQRIERELDELATLALVEQPPPEENEESDHECEREPL